MEGCSGDTVSEECKRALDGCHLTPSPPMFESVVETIAATEAAMHDDDAANADEESVNVSCAADILSFQNRQSRSSKRG
jgi:hypothetical protein